MKFTIGILLRWIPDKWPWRRRYKWQYSPEWSRLFHLDCRWVQERWRHSSGEHTCKDKWRGSVTVTHPLLVNKKKNVSVMIFVTHAVWSSHKISYFCWSRTVDIQISINIVYILTLPQTRRSPTSEKSSHFRRATKRFYPRFTFRILVIYLYNGVECRRWKNIWNPKLTWNILLFIKWSIVIF